MRRTLLILPMLLMFGCSTAHDPDVIGNDYESVRTFMITVTVHKYRKESCIQAGGMWIVGDDYNFTNALVGCVEPTAKGTK